MRPVYSGEADTVFTSFTISRVKTGNEILRLSRHFWGHCKIAMHSFFQLLSLFIVDAVVFVVSIKSQRGNICAVVLLNICSQSAENLEMNCLSPASLKAVSLIYSIGRSLCDSATMQMRDPKRVFLFWRSCVPSVTISLTDGLSVKIEPLINSSSSFRRCCCGLSFFCRGSSSVRKREQKSRRRVLVFGKQF